MGFFTKIGQRIDGLAKRVNPLMEITTERKSLATVADVMAEIQRQLGVPTIVTPSRTGPGSGVGVWAPTDQQYIPSKFSAPVDGGMYGNTNSSLEAIRQCEELAIAMTRMANTLAAMPWDICDLDGNPIDKKGGKDHPAAALLMKPNPLCNWSDFIKTAVFMKVTGNRFILVDDSHAPRKGKTPGNTPFRIWLLRSDRTRPIRSQDPTTPIAGYEHYAEDGRRYVFPIENVVHQKDPNPFTSYVGMAPTQLLDMTLNMDMAMLEYNWRFFLQGGDPTTIINSDKTIDKKRKDELIQQFKQNYENFHNAHRMLILDDGMKKDSSANKGPKEVDFIASVKEGSRKVGGFFGIPPLLMGHVEDANRANSASQMQLYMTHGVSPEARDLNELITYVIQRFDDSITFKFRQPQILDDEIATEQMTAALTGGAMSPNEARMKYLGLQPDPNPAMDKHYVPLNMVALEDMDTMNAQKIENPQGADSAATDPAASGGKTGKEPKPGVRQPGMPPPGDETPDRPPEVDEKPMSFAAAVKYLAEEKKPPKGTNIQRRVLNFLVKNRASGEKQIFKAVNRYILAMTAATVKKLGDLKAPKETTPAQAFRILDASPLYDTIKQAQDSTPMLTTQLVPIYNAELTAQYAALASLFKVSIPAFDTSSSAWSNSSAKLATRVTGIESTVQGQLNDLIKEGMDLGLTPWQIANGTTDGSFEGILATMEGSANERAMLIARTEIAALQHQSSVNAYQAMGVKIVDIIGCEDFKIMPGQTYGCNSLGIPIDQALAIEFHPNHLGGPVPAKIDKPEQQAALLGLFHVEQ